MKKKEVATEVSHTTSRPTGDYLPGLYKAKTEEQQTAFIVREVEKLVTMVGMQPKIVILARASSMLAPIQKALTDKGYNYIETAKGNELVVEPNVIELTTCSSLKGKSWEYVFVVNVVAGVFPADKEEADEFALFQRLMNLASKRLVLVETPAPLTVGGKKKVVSESSPFLSEELYGKYFHDLNHQQWIESQPLMQISSLTDHSRVS